jgi:hypothetical protein
MQAVSLHYSNDSGCFQRSPENAGSFDDQSDMPHHAVSLECLESFSEQRKQGADQLALPRKHQSS